MENELKEDKEDGQEILFVEDGISTESENSIRETLEEDEAMEDRTGEGISTESDNTVGDVVEEDQASQDRRTQEDIDLEMGYTANTGLQTAMMEKLFKNISFKRGSQFSRSELVKSVQLDRLSLGSKLQHSGRSVLYHLLSDVINGDKIVLQKLDSQITVMEPAAVKEEEKLQDDAEKVDESIVSIDYDNLVDPRSWTDSILKDLLDLPVKKTSAALNHPVIILFIERRWRKTKWMFLISFLLYLAFLLIFSTFLGLMYFRESRPIPLFRGVVPRCSPR